MPQLSESHDDSSIVTQELPSQGPGDVEAVSCQIGEEVSRARGQEPTASLESRRASVSSNIENLKIYFCGSIRGGRQDASVYREIIAHMRRRCDVLTEDIGDAEYVLESAGPEADKKIYHRNVSWLREADIVIAEVTSPSLGVGYEIALAEALGKPVVCLFRPSCGRSLSALIRGNPGFTVWDYETVEEACGFIDEALEKRHNLIQHSVEVKSYLMLGGLQW